MTFGSDADFSISKTYSAITQGFRFRLDRNRMHVKTTFIPISKKGGLMRPGLLGSEDNYKQPELIVNNLLTGKPSLILKEDPKTQSWSIVNAEAGNVVVGQAKTTQNGDRKIVSFSNNGAEVVSLTFRCPV